MEKTNIHKMNLDLETRMCSAMLQLRQETIKPFKMERKQEPLRIEIIIPEDENIERIIREIMTNEDLTLTNTNYQENGLKTRILTYQLSNPDYMI
jgi:hypothetical protein